MGDIRHAITETSAVRVGLTGGMGCGKSSVLGYFKELGCRTIDTDAVVKQLLDEDAAVQEQLLGRFGSDVVAGGQVNRKALAAAVFGDAAQLQWLEALLHPRVRQHWLEAIEQDATSTWVVEIPLLFEKNLENHFEMIVCVSVSVPTQLERLAGRGFTREQSLARMAHQLPLEEKERRADFVISNNGSLHSTRLQVAQLALI